MQSTHLKKIKSCFKNKENVEEFFKTSFFQKLPKEIQETLKEKYASSIPLTEIKNLLIQGINLSFGRNYQKIELFVTEMVQYYSHPSSDEKPTYNQIIEFLDYLENVFKPKLLEKPVDEIIELGWNQFCLAQGIPNKIPLPEIFQKFINNKIDSSNEKILETLEYEEIFDFFNRVSKEESIILILCHGIWAFFIDNTREQFIIDSKNRIDVIGSIFDIFLEFLDENRAKIGNKKKYTRKLLSDMFFELEKNKFIIQIWMEMLT